MKIFYRKCSVDGRGMNEGYMVGDDYFCSDKCLHSRYTQEEYLEMYDDGNSDDCYYTEWMEGDDWGVVFTATGREIEYPPLKISLRIDGGWSAPQENENRFFCDVCHAKLWIAPDGKTKYCDAMHQIETNIIAGAK